MKKNILFILIFILFLPIVANAEKCDTENITIKSINLESKSDNVEEINDVTTNGKNIDLDLSLSEVGDNIKYKMIISNGSNDDYELETNSFIINSDYIKYTIETNDDSNIINAKSDKTIYLRVEYKNKVPQNEFSSGVYNYNKSMSIDLSSGKIIISDTSTPSNPNTSNNNYILLIFLIMILLVSTIIIKNKYAKALLLLISLIIPSTVYALCKCEIKIESNIIINESSNNIYWALQDLDNNDINETLVISKYYIDGKINGYFDNNATFNSFDEVPWVKAYATSQDNLSYNVTDVIIKNDIYPNSTAYWFAGVGYNAESFTTDLYKLHTENVTDMSNMFMFTGRNATTWNLNGIENFNTENVTNMSKMFSSSGGKGPDLYLDLSSFNTSNVTAMNSMFLNFGSGVKTYNIKGLTSFDVSNVITMDDMFDSFLTSATNWNFNFSNWNTSSLQSAKEIFRSAGSNSNSLSLNVSNWDTSRLTNFDYLFYELGKEAKTWTLNGINTWNTQSVTKMVRTFSYAAYKANSFSININNWNTSNVTDMYGMFDCTGYWSTSWNIGNINTWNVSNVKDMGDMFSFAGGNVSTLNLNLSNWNTSSATKMERMFEYTGNYSDYVYIDIRNFNMSNVTDVSRMFGAYSNSRYRTWRVTIPRTNGNNIENTTTIINGKNTSFDVTSDYGLNKNNARFTLANN